ncbi:hypothetical protein K488DRAFT_40011 [Vararia minispora EC-137]|uniref:Uncharacterized protein n=1 Tax=Vararia minispora EC-137 TaxID=1314806 RepID=A0ACB8QYN8_9AGAM|nr:hypothetical protein K488DRAFT_40011 [Vararia minispora EC-137]
MIRGIRVITFVFVAALTTSVLFATQLLTFSQDLFHGTQQARNEQLIGEDCVQGPLSNPLKYNLSDIWFPQYVSDDELWVGHNTGAFRSLLSCMQRDSCGPNQVHLVIIGSWFIRDALLPTKFAGEHVWCRDHAFQLQALDNLRYTYVFATDNLDIARIHKMFPSLVIAILFEPFDLQGCLDDEIRCVKSARNPHGIPVWKLLMFTFWAEARGPLGEKWTLSPEPYQRLSRNYPHNAYVGYSIESTCYAHPTIPHSERPDQVYFMSKKAQWFVSSWPRDFYDAAVDELGVQFVMGLHDSTAKVPDHPDIPLAQSNIPFPKGVKDLGALQPHEFLAELSRSKAIIGLGAPVTSPTPYEALCLGVPFINPIKSWDYYHPKDRYSWNTQHDMLKFMDAPYVYNVFQNDKKAFVRAIKSALETPIQPFVFDDMKLPAIQKRLHAILQRDHYGMAKVVLERRLAGLEDGPVRQITWCRCAVFTNVKIIQLFVL